MNKDMIKVDMTEDEITNLWIEMHRPEPTIDRRLFWEFDYENGVQESTLAGKTVTVQLTKENFKP